MFYPGQNFFRITLLIFLSCTLSACTVKATLKSTSDAISNVLSSTSGHSWFTEDGLVKKGEEALAFASMNFENLQHDMAQGRGEYLESFAILMSIKSERIDEFNAFTQTRFTTLIGSSTTSPIAFMVNLKRELTSSSGLNVTKTVL